MNNKQTPQAVQQTQTPFFEQAVKLYQQGQYQQVIALVRAGLTRQPGHSGLLNVAAAAAMRLGLMQEAERYWRAAIQALPTFAEAHNNLGNLLRECGRSAEAEAAYRQALAIRPAYAEAHCNLAILLQEQGRLAPAEAAFRQALAARPTLAQAHYGLGNLLRRRDSPLEAEAAYRAALALHPEYAEAANNLGNLLAHQGRAREAEAALRHALAGRPHSAEIHGNLGNLLSAQGRLGEAEALYRRALELDPDYAPAHNSLGALWQRLGRLEQAEAALRQALRLQPALADAHNNLGTLLQVRGRPQEAEAAFRRAIALRPQDAATHLNLGNLLKDLGRLTEALATLRTALAIEPERPEVLNQLLFQSQYTCDWRELAEHSGRVRTLVRAGVGPVMPFSFLALDAPLAEQLACARQWTERMVVIDAGSVFTHTPGRRSPRIRVGYLSADFYSHATAYLTAELFERHDRDRFEVIGYSYGPDDGSAVRARLERAFDRFVDIRALSHAGAAARIHDDAVDILVDLKGYTTDCRPAILAHRPAPVQVNYLGYPGTMGAPFIDYLMADALVAPFEHQEFYSEALVHLPDCYQPNDTRRAIAERTPTRAECGLPQSGLVFCCFNNSYKITPEFFDIWMWLLAQTPGSVLWLLETNPLARDNLRREAAARGVDPARLVFAPRLPLPEHLARHRLADLFLDTLPVNAHTTASDALWAGLPVLTCIGESFIGRVGASLLQAVGLPELVTDSPTAYAALALCLAREPARLAALRARLVANRASAPLFDSERFTRHIEMAYRQMWARYCAGQPPAAFAVAVE